MKTKDAIDGQLYNLPQPKGYLGYEEGECHGLNYTGEWMLFLVFNEWGERKIRMIGLDTEITPITL